MFNGVVPMAAPIMQILSRSLCSVRLFCFFTVLGVLAMAGAATAQADRLISIGSRDSLWSDVLGEERPYWVYLPASYDDARYALVDYPVLYLLDGDTHFHLATGVVQFMSEGANANIQIPEMIVVGVPSSNRTRDLTPTHTTNRPNGGHDATLSASGGGDAFLAFLNQELVPAVEEAYRAKPYRVLVGHSFGGLMALHAFLDAPDLFQAHVAIDPSLFWDDEILVRQAEQLTTNPASRPRVVYLSLSGHPPGGRMDGPARSFASALASQASSRLRSTLERYDDESHGSVPLLSLYRGLRFVFDGYGVTSRQLFDAPERLGEHFAAASRRSGVTWEPPERILDLLGHSFLNAGLLDKAVALFTVNTSTHPTSFNAFASLAEAQAVGGRTALAVQAYTRSLELSPDNSLVRRALDRLRR